MSNSHVVMASWVTLCSSSLYEVSMEPVTFESDRHQRRGRDLLHLGFAVPAEVFEKFGVQLERAGQAYLHSFRVAELHPARRVKQQATRLN